ncbi:hypothetical protein SKAU_G00121430 [Synaphobranchus kaupii]|uniref:AB hydrolase-1 domain-containing protein n=1 Tax=Synaphobranchus kaupii TaxID=118154 RepID=A0A9Q1FPH3_SYNKA|nr:hypothetical protein SKAU_G00121430 [Synaphobranchus kaupii]
MFKILSAVRNLSTGGAMKQAVSELCVPVPWGQIRGKVWGPDDGRPVLCLHGWSDNCGSFNTLIPQLPKEWRYVAMDMVGHGLSSHRPDGVFYMFPSYMADVCRVIEALEWKRFTIIGHSMGGNVATMFSAVYPEMVESVVLLDSYGFFPTQEKNIPGLLREGIDGMIQYEKKKAERREKVYTYEKAVERLKAANPSLSEQSVHILLERGSSEVEGGVMFTRDFRINLTNIARITMTQVLEMLSRIQARVLVVLVDEGLHKSLSESEKQMTEELLKVFNDKGARVVTVLGDHHVHLNSPETVAQIVSDFLQGVEHRASVSLSPLLILKFYAAIRCISLPLDTVEVNEDGALQQTSLGGLINLSAADRTGSTAPQLQKHALVIPGLVCSSIPACVGARFGRFRCLPVLSGTRTTGRTQVELSVGTPSPSRGTR